MTDQKEALAAYSHDAWRFWMYYLFSKSILNADGTVTIPAEFVSRWERQTETEYAQLPEYEKESDRVEADKILAICKPEQTAELERKLKMAEGLLMSDQFKMTRLQEQLTIAQEFRKLVEMLPPDSYLMHCPVTNQVAWQAIAGDIDSPDCKIAWGDTPLETLQKLIPMLKENHGTASDHR